MRIEIQTETALETQFSRNRIRKNKGKIRARLDYEMLILSFRASLKLGIALPFSTNFMAMNGMKIPCFILYHFNVIWSGIGDITKTLNFQPIH